MYTVTIRALDLNSAQQNVENSFQLIVYCIDHLAPTTTISDIVYYINDAAITKTFGFTWSPNYCLNPNLQITMTQSNGSALPAEIVFTAPGSFQVYSNN